ncbi:hypothetical protein ACJMK2_011910 [Sinanodonta woodiana]|uniref:Bacteriophage T5 Orf172 DNA-binding domain-containing protein n=1 Tax=Sinanodonta woodiana TaxID=1069815 RepID=A0ABD3V9F4_SINWO
MDMQGGAAGSAKGKGYVYCMKDGNQFKVGCSSDPKERLKQIKAQKGREKAKLLCKVKAREMNRAESAAQARVKQNLGFEKRSANATDWFRNPNKQTKKKITKEVRKAVYAHNKKQKQKRKQN